MAQFHLIKHYKEREGLSERQIAKKLGISRNTVSKYLKTCDMPTSIKRKEVYGKSKLSEETLRVLPIIDEWLSEDQKTWKKQQHTAKRIYDRLVDEYQFKGSESNIRKVVRRQKNKLQEVFIPLEFQLGQQFQFDWGEADVYVREQLQRIYLFCFQSSASRKRFVRAYVHEKQEAFLDGFVRAFEYLGGVPTIGLFDNLKTAVVKVLEGRDRLEQEAFQALQAHYLFRAEFCNVRKGNEKGRVEGLVGYTRRNALTPLPRVQDLEELNDILLAWCTKTDQDLVPHTSETVSQVWEREKTALHPLPAHPFEACRTVSGTVSKISTVSFDTNQYSVPCAYVGQTVWVKGFVDRVIVVAQNQTIAQHLRCYERGKLKLQLDHYLEALLRKPRAVRDAQVMHSPEIPETMRQFHLEMNRRHGAEGDRGFVRFLLLHRQVGMETLLQALERAEKSGVYRYEGLQEIVRRLTGEVPSTSTLNQEDVTIDLQNYRIQKTDLRRYSALIEGGR